MNTFKKAFKLFSKLVNNLEVDYNPADQMVKLDDGKWLPIEDVSVELAYLQELYKYPELLYRLAVDDNYVIRSIISSKKYLKDFLDILILLSFDQNDIVHKKAIRNLGYMKPKMEDVEKAIDLPLDNTSYDNISKTFEILLQKFPEEKDYLISLEEEIL